jgi:hypothetical protein
MASNEPIDDPYVQISLELRMSTIDWLDGLKEEWGIRSRNDAISRLLDELKPSRDVSELSGFTYIRNRPTACRNKGYE